VVMMKEAFMVSSSGFHGLQGFHWWLVCPRPRFLHRNSAFAQKSIRVIEMLHPISKSAKRKPSSPVGSVQARETLSLHRVLFLCLCFVDIDDISSMRVTLARHSSTSLTCPSLAVNSSCRTVTILVRETLSCRRRGRWASPLSR
jgi:hypothetical protein